MKDEFKDKITSEFVGLKSLVDVYGEENKRVKGVKKNVVKKKNLLIFFFNKKLRRHMKRIQSKLHRIETYDVWKLSSSCFDDKRYVLDDGIYILAFFDKDIKRQ